MNWKTCRVLSNICFQLGILSIVLSIVIWWATGGGERQPYAERLGIFVGLWAPTLLILSNRFDRYADRAKEQRPPALHDENLEENLMEEAPGS